MKLTFERTDQASIKTLGDIQRELNLVQSLTEDPKNPNDAVVPALIYAFFVPENFDLETLEQEINQFAWNGSQGSLSPR